MSFMETPRAYLSQSGVLYSGHPEGIFAVTQVTLSDNEATDLVRFLVPWNDNKKDNDSTHRHKISYIVH